jgi:alkylated DNA repair dioxygenase AlkB
LTNLESWLGRSTGITQVGGVPAVVPHQIFNPSTPTVFNFKNVNANIDSGADQSENPFKFIFLDSIFKDNESVSYFDNQIEGVTAPWVTPFLVDREKKSFSYHINNAVPVDLLDKTLLFLNRLKWDSPFGSSRRQSKWATTSPCSCHYTYSGLDFAPIPLTGILRELADFLETTTGVQFNCCNLNRYPGGRCGLRYHADDEALFGHADTVIASVSLGATRSFAVKHKAGGDEQESIIELEAGSLLVMGGMMQRHFLHAILPAATETTEWRWNLTFRWLALHTTRCACRSH